jgi:ribonuclease HI
VKVVIISDASFCPETGASGFCYWAVSGRGQKGGYGAISERVDNSITSEMMAMIQGLNDACANKLILTEDDVLFRTDCKAAIDAFRNERKNIGAQETELVNYLYNFRIAHRLKIKFEHVKGHTGEDDKLSFVQAQCDKLARISMKRARQLFL